MPEPSKRTPPSVTDVAEFAGDCATIYLAEYGGADGMIPVQLVVDTLHQLQGLALRVPVTVVEATMHTAERAPNATAVAIWPGSDKA